MKLTPRERAQNHARYVVAKQAQVWAPDRIRAALVEAWLAGNRSAARARRSNVVTCPDCYLTFVPRSIP